MTHFAVPFQSNAGPIIKACIGVSPIVRDALIAAGRKPPALIALNLLIDTGASNTTLCQSKIKLLALQPTSFYYVHTPSTGDRPARQWAYNIALIFIGNAAGLSDGSVQNIYSLPTHEVLEADFAGQSIDGILGRDVLKDCHMTYLGQEGLCILSFGSRSISTSADYELRGKSEIIAPKSADKAEKGGSIFFKY